MAPTLPDSLSRCDADAQFTPSEASAAWRLPRAAAEAGQALLVIALFAIGGLCVAAGASRPGSAALPLMGTEVWPPAAAYPSPAMSDPEQDDATPPEEAPEPESVLPRRWLIDGYNLLHVALLGGKPRAAQWWNAAHRSQVLTAVASYEDPAAELVVVFDGSEPPEAQQEPDQGTAGRARVPAIHFAPSADDWVVRELRACADPAAVGVVTADRRLAARARSKGAHVEKPAVFLRRCLPPRT